MIFKLKLTYMIVIATILIFVFLTGGVKYSHITYMYVDKVSCCEEKIEIFGIYYKKFYGGKLNFSETDFVWRFSPSFRIFSIAKVVKTVD